MAKDNKGGRPVKEINLEELDKLCAMQCTCEEVAGWFDVSVDTVERRVLEMTGMGFAAYFKLKRGKGKVSLRRKQMQVALGGNTTMLIWLGKQYLEQKDKQEIEHSGGVDFYVSLTPEERKARIEELGRKLASHG
jgi:hypothetical protein